MIYSIVVRRIAEAELELGKAWYNSNRTDLGDEFVEAFYTSAQAIREAPLQWPLYHKNVRRYVMRRFPYIIYFDIKLDTIRILRVVHASRDPIPIRELFP